MKLSSRLTLVMVGLVVATAIAVGWLTYRNLETAILPRALERVESRVRLLAAELAIYVRSARADIVGFRSAVALNGIVRAHVAGGIDPLDGTSEAAWRLRMAERYAIELASKPAYSLFRIIGADDGGREIVRVDRSGKDGAIRIVPDAELQKKGDRAYFKAALSLPPGEIYVSPVELAREHGMIETPHEPVLRVATPIQAPDGRPFGIVMIDVDLRAAFGDIRTAARPGSKTFVINERGDYLLHPDLDREFAFELGSASRWQDDFPRYAAAFGPDETGARAVTDADGNRAGVAMAWVRLAGGPEGCRGGGRAGRRPGGGHHDRSRLQHARGADRDPVRDRAGGDLRTLAGTAIGAKRPRRSKGSHTVNRRPFRRGPGAKSACWHAPSPG